ncbi:MAG: hypothetical protein AB2556_16105, partial [Candidatus Thiodiazotropha sp.]
MQAEQHGSVVAHGVEDSKAPCQPFFGHFWLPPVGAGKFAELEIEIDPARVFQSRDSRKISWNPIRVVAVSPALAEPKAVAATTPSQPFRRGPWVF